MATVSELWGRSEGNKRHWWVFVGGYAGIVLALLLVVSFVGSTPADTVLPVALFYAPPVVSAMSAVRGGDFLASLAVGFTPGVLYGIVVGSRALLTHATTAELPLWSLALGFGILGVAGAVLGYGVGKGVLRFVQGWAKPVVRTRIEKKS